MRILDNEIDLAILSEDAQLDHGKELEVWRGQRCKAAYLPLVRPK